MLIHPLGKRQPSMKLILHCGEAKTGSSSIQKMLKNSSKKLLKKKILYYCEGSNQNTLSYISGRRHRVPKDKDKFLEERMKSIVAKIKYLAKQLEPNYIILSSEFFFGLPLDDIKKTINYLGIAFTEIYCIVYVKNPDEFYLSSTQQKIKASHKILNPLTFKRNIISPLTTWQQFTGSSNFIGTAFGRETLFKGDVVADFIEKIKSITQENIDVKKWPSKNESITAEQTVLLQEYRRDFLSDFDNQFMPSSSILLKLFCQINALKKLGTKLELKAEIREAILFNNKEYILSANKILSGQLKLNSADFLENQYHSTSWNGNHFTNVKDILHSFDKEAFRLFKSIIIEYNKSLRSGFEKYLLAFDDKKMKEKAATAYFKYLKSNDYFSSEQLKQSNDSTGMGHIHILKKLIK